MLCDTHCQTPLSEIWHHLYEQRISDEIDYTSLRLLGSSVDETLV